MIAERSSTSNCIIMVFRIIIYIIFGFVMLMCTMFFILGLGMYIDHFRDFTKDNYVPAETAKQVLKLRLYDEKTKKTLYGILYDDGEIFYTNDSFDITVRIGYKEYSSNAVDSRIFNCVNQEIGDHWLLTDIRQFIINDQKYIFFQLNVNWWTPSDLYVYNEERNCIEMLYEWDGVLITGAAPPDITEFKTITSSQSYYSDLPDVWKQIKNLIGY